MIKKTYFIFLLVLSFLSCKETSTSQFSETERASIRFQIESDLAADIKATRNKNIDRYLERFPENLVIYDENGELYEE